MPRGRPRAWVPRQHGAWAIRLVPLRVGVIQRLRAASAGHAGDQWWLLPLAATWILGYFCFNAASIWLKTPGNRRPGVRPPVIAYLAATAVSAALTLALAGVRVLPWGVPFALLLGPALWLAAGRRERSLASGLCTVSAAGIMTLLARFPDPALLWRDWPAPEHDEVVAALVWLWFVTTLFYVRSMIRERGHRSFWVISISVHLTALAVALALAPAGLAVWWWAPLFALASLRAWLVGSRGARGRPIPPRTVGLAEIPLLLVMVACALW